jgi:hypothetical protein
MRKLTFVLTGCLLAAFVFGQYNTAITTQDKYVNQVGIIQMGDQNYSRVYQFKTDMLSGTNSNFSCVEKSTVDSWQLA